MTGRSRNKLPEPCPNCKEEDGFIEVITVKHTEIVRIRHAWKEKPYCRLDWSDSERFKQLKLGNVVRDKAPDDFDFKDFNNEIIDLNKRYKKDMPIDYRSVFKRYQTMVSSFDLDDINLHLMDILFDKNPHFYTPFHRLIFCEFWLKGMKILITRDPVRFRKYLDSENHIDLPRPWNEWHHLLTFSIERKKWLLDVNKNKNKLDPLRFPRYVKELKSMLLSEFAQNHGVSTKAAKKFITGHIASRLFPTIYQPANREHAIWLGFTGEICPTCSGMRIEGNSDGGHECLDCEVRKPTSLSS